MISWWGYLALKLLIPLFFQVYRIIQWLRLVGSNLWMSSVSLATVVVSVLLTLYLYWLCIPVYKMMELAFDFILQSKGAFLCGWPFPVNCSKITESPSFPSSHFSFSKVHCLGDAKTARSATPMKVIQGQYSSVRYWHKFKFHCLVKDILDNPR